VVVRVRIEDVAIRTMPSGPITGRNHTGIRRALAMQNAPTRTAVPAVTNVGVGCPWTNPGTVASRVSARLPPMTSSSPPTRAAVDRECG
jgi:hypothetical protein